VRLVQYYFGSKEKLLLGGLHRVGELIAERISARLAALPGTAGARDRAEATLVEMLPRDTLTRDLYAVHAEYAALALTDQALAEQPYASGVNNLQAEITRLICAAQERGEIPLGRKPDNVALSLLAMATGMAAAVIVGQQDLDAVTSALREHLDALFTPGMSPAPSSGPSCAV
jgi:AcrR family transcriptional regulator